MAFNFPVFRPPAMPGRPMYDPGTPAGGADLADTGAPVKPWPWVTGFLGVKAQPVGNPMLQPAAPKPSPTPIMDNNPFSGIIAGLFKG